MLVEQPLDPDWKLLEPKEPAEKTRDLYRFAVTAEPGKTAKLKVSEERIAPGASGGDQHGRQLIGYYLQQPVVSERVKTALARGRSPQAGDRDRDQPAHRSSNSKLSRSIKSKTAFGRTWPSSIATPICTRSTSTKFSKQEDDVERLRGEIKTRLDQETALRKSLDDFLNGLELS